MSKVILFKNNKGGVGKSLLCFWTGHILSTIDKNYKNEKNKVLILTSDSQNNILQLAGVDTEFRNGLQGYLEGRGNDLIALSENLFYVPLETSQIKRSFEEKFLEVVEVFKKQYDYILIDASPVLKLDDIFLSISDEVVIPTFLDNITTKGMLNLVEEIGIDKVSLIVPNRVGRSKLERIHLENLKSSVGGYVEISRSIPQTSKVMELTEKGKTIMETKSKRYLDLQETFVEIVEEIM